MAERGSPAVFLDKDGTLVRNVPYNVDAARLELADGAGRALAALSGAGFRLVVVTNQSGVARGYFGEEALVQVRAALHRALREGGAAFDRFYHCPHHPDGTEARYAVSCSCRKPQPGLLLRAASDLNLDLARSWLVGDILDDIEAGRRAGCRTILVGTGNETEWDLSTTARTPHYVVPGLREAADVILGAGQYGREAEDPHPPTVSRRSP